MRAWCALVLFALATPALAQVQTRPTDPPTVTAEREDWFVRGDPVLFAGNLYFRAGAAVFFDGNRMVRTGYFNGVPLYADTTIEPFSIVYVPIRRGLLQPYERPRSGELAGTTGSHAPSFPVTALPDGSLPLMAAGPPTSLAPGPLGAEEAPAPGLIGETSVRIRDFGGEAEDESGVAAAGRQPLRPEDIEAARQRVWVEFRGQKWVSAGPAIPLQGSDLVQTGERAGFAVFTRPGEADRIYLPALPGLVAPYRASPQP